MILWRSSIFLFFWLPWSTIAFALSWSESTTRSTTAVSSSKTIDDDLYQVKAEVVGATGRMGSLFLTQDARAVPKGIAPGCLSRDNTPIYVATPAKAWPQIWEDTLPHRRDDLVWIGNGIPPTHSSTGIDTTTIVVPHFGVLQVNADPVTSPLSPPTYIYGKHGPAVERILRRRGIQTIETVDSYSDIMVKAAQKLLWASSMWLLCHDHDINDNNKSPMTALQVHSERSQDLKALVEKELLPALAARFESLLSTTTTNDTHLPLPLQLDPKDALDYMHRYSQSMPTAIPNLQLAKQEWKERNAFFLQVRDKVPQPRHEELLKRVGGITDQDIKDATTIQTNSSPPQQESTTPPVTSKVDVPFLGLSFRCTPPSSLPHHSRTPVQTVIVVGGGILGSSVAMHLARQEGIQQVTVVDAAPASVVGRTTPASWAWLNANGKSPPAYACLNMLGMDGWRRDPVLSRLPTWCGSLVRFDKPQLLGGGYRYEGPLSLERVQELEPLADLHTHDNENESDIGVSTKEPKNFVYYYPDEGLVDPSVAVDTMRKEAVRLGVRFLSGHNVTGVIRDNGAVSGITTTSLQDGKTTVMKADVIVLAAGVGSADLGSIPLLHRPGQIAFAHPAQQQQSESKSTGQLKRILVDTVRESHVLQRQDGSLVVGGGALEVGGDGTVAMDMKGPISGAAATHKDHGLLRVAQQLIPGVLGELYRTESAVRPIPLDGLPAVGFLEPGFYCVVSHSGVTLSPILGCMAATELSRAVDLPALEPFRPTRFFEQ